MKRYFFLLFFISILLIAGCNTNILNEEIIKSVNAEDGVTLYKSSSCGCCGLYSSYLDKNGKLDVKIIDSTNMDFIKNENNIPNSLTSCHTTIIGDYFVEGHIPLEAIDKLLTEKPDIAGIAMAGMPSGSPGMPGAKTGDFIIYGVNHDGSYNEFMRI